MSLVGALAGLFAWAAQAILVSLLPVDSAPWAPVLIASSFLGAWIGGLTVGFDDKWSGNRIQARWVAMGVLIGAVAGTVSGALQIPIRRAVAGSPGLSVVLGWLLTGALIGLGLGLRWVSINHTRVAHGMLGGMAGGFLGGVVFGTLSDLIPDVSQAMAFLLTGAGISFGITFAPILLRDAVVRFVSSGDPRAVSKIGKKEWELQDGDNYLVGSESADVSKSRYGRDVEIYLPDATVAPRHARIYGKEGRFFVARHPDTMSEAGLRRYVLRVRDRSVTSPRELQHDDLIVLGRTTLAFIARKNRLKAQ